jgi:4-hydroxy 2-oxovalerate aldolase
MEMGYKASTKILSPTTYGKWKFCSEDDLRRIVGDDKSGDMKISVMADVGRTDYHTDILPKKDSVIETVRVAAYIHQIPAAIDMINDAHQKGYETVMQLMSVSVVQEHELDAFLQEISQTPVSAVYLVDSFGALYSEQVRYLTTKYLSVLKECGKEVGIHAHNNQQLAYANTIEAIIAGANRMDATISGLGRGAGNCPLELIVGFLHNPRFKLRPILECIEEVMLPLKEKLDWGFSIPYMITGQMNMHPRTAMDLRASPNKDKYVQFYDRTIE